MPCVTIFITLTVDLVDISHKLRYIYSAGYITFIFFVYLMVKIIMSAY